MPYRDRVSSPRRMESMLAEQLCAGDDFVLGDYFGQAAAGDVAVEHFAGFLEGRP